MDSAGGNLKPACLCFLDVMPTNMGGFSISAGSWGTWLSAVWLSVCVCVCLRSTSWGLHQLQICQFRQDACFASYCHEVAFGTLGTRVGPEQSAIRIINRCVRIRFSLLGFGQSFFFILYYIFPGCIQKHLFGDNKIKPSEVFCVLKTSQLFSDKSKVTSCSPQVCSREGPTQEAGVFMVHGGTGWRVIQFSRMGEQRITDFSLIGCPS